MGDRSPWQSEGDPQEGLWASQKRKVPSEGQGRVLQEVFTRNWRGDSRQRDPVLAAWSGEPGSMALPAGPPAEGSALTHGSRMDCTCQPAGTGGAPYGASQAEWGSQ